MRLFGTSPEARVWLSADCCGLLMAGITWFLVLYAVVVVGDLVYHWLGVSTEAVLIEGTMILLASMSLLSHTRAMLTNPGAVPPGARPLPLREEQERNDPPNPHPYKSWCVRCGTYKPPRAHHDSCTQRCVSKMDHFCPWVNNCIGVLNHKLFILFIFYILLISVFTLAVVGCRTYSCAARAQLRRQPPTPSPSLSPAALLRRRRRFRRDDSFLVHVLEAFFDYNECHLGIPVFFLIMEGMLFSLFTFAMLCDQYSVMATGVAGIDRRKGMRGSRNDQVHEVFGGTPVFKWSWLWPAPPDFGPHKDAILGFLPPRDDNKEDV